MLIYDLSFDIMFNVLYYQSLQHYGEYSRNFNYFHLWFQTLSFESNILLT